MLIHTEVHRWIIRCVAPSSPDLLFNVLQEEGIIHLFHALTLSPLCTLFILQLRVLFQQHQYFFAYRYLLRSSMGGWCKYVYVPAATDWII